MGVKSTLKKQSDFLKMLADPGSIKRELDALIKVKETTTKQMKELYEGKSKKAFCKTIEDAVEAGEARLKEIEKVCKDKAADIEKQAEEFAKKVSKEAAAIKSRLDKIGETDDLVEEKLKEISRDQAVAARARKAAEDDRKIAAKIRKDLEEKQAKLKAAVGGLS